MNKDFWMQFFLDAKIDRDFASEYADNFISHQIGPWNLHLLNQVYLEAMGIKPLGHIMSILDQKEKRLSVPMSEYLQRWPRSEAPGGEGHDERQKCRNDYCTYSSKAWVEQCRSCSMKNSLIRLLLPELQLPINTAVSRNPEGNRVMPAPRARSNSECSSDQPSFFKAPPRVEDMPMRNQLDSLTVPYLQSRLSISSTVPINPGGNRMSPVCRTNSNPEISGGRPPFLKALPRLDDLPTCNQPRPLTVPYLQSRPSTSSTVPTNPGGNRMSPVCRTGGGRPPFLKALPRLDDLPTCNQPLPLTVPYLQSRPSTSSTIPKNPGGNRMPPAPGGYSNPEISNDRKLIFKGLTKVDNTPIRNQPDLLNVPYHQSRPSTSSNLPKFDDSQIRNQPDPFNLPYQRRPSTSSTIPRNPGGTMILTPHGTYSNPEISGGRPPFFKALPRVDDMPIRNQADPLTEPYLQSRPSTSSIVPRNPEGNKIPPASRAYTNLEISSDRPLFFKSLPRVDDLPIRNQSDALNLPYHQSRPSTSSFKENKKEHTGNNWKLCQAKEKIHLPKNVNVPFSGNENSIEGTFMDYFRHRAVSMKIEMQEEIEAISKRKPIASFTGKGCLKKGSETLSGGRKNKLDQNNTDMYPGEEDVPLRVGFRSGGPDVKMISPADKVPPLHSILEKGNLHFRSHLRRDRCLTLLSLHELEELNATFPNEISESVETWRGRLDQTLTHHSSQAGA